MEKLKLFACTNCPGVYLNSVVVIFATDEITAKMLLHMELYSQGLVGINDKLQSVVEIPTDNEGAHILFDGDY